MKAIILALSLSCVQCTVPVAAQSPTPEQIEAACLQQGGCIRVSIQWLNEMIAFYVMQALLFAEEKHKAKLAQQCPKDV